MFWGGRDTANEYCWCVRGAHTLWAKVGLPQAKSVCASWVYMAQAPGCSARALSQVGPEFCAFPRSKPLRFWVFHKGTDWLGMCFGPFLGPSSSDDRVLAEHSVLGEPCVLLT